MDATGELDVQSLLDGLEKIHDQMMRHVVSAERQHVLVILPITLHQGNVQTFFFEKALLDRGENRCFTREADVTDADFGRAAAGAFRFPAATANKQRA